MNFANLLKTAPFISWDFLMTLAVLTAFLLLGLVWKKKRILVIILSLYLARLFLALFSLPKFIKEINIGMFTGELFAFWGIFVILFLAFAGGGISLRAVSASRLKRKKKTKYKALKGATYGFFAAGLFLIFTLSFMGVTFTGDLSLLVSFLFTTEIAMITWTLLPIIAMLVIK